MDPSNNDSSKDNSDSAADIVRQKIENLYDEEPDAEAEESEIRSGATESKHQKFMQALMNSGKSSDQIQNDWHQYYLGLNDEQKKEVWDEFYASNENKPAIKRKTEPAKQLAGLKNQVVAPKQFESTKHKTSTRRHKALKVAPKIKQAEQVSSKAKLKPKHYFQSLLFGISMGMVVLIIFLFGFFNQVVIAPLIQPNRNAAATPVIIGNGDLTATNVDQVIIPKINVEIPVNYSIKTADENLIENDLEDGVIHYPNTAVPGQIGNAAYFGHSSNNIFNPGKYKFAFVLLHTLENGDTFYLTYNHTVYIYKVISTNIVDPSDVAVLGPVANQTATATLITCDPPGTSLHRLVVVGTQISPSVNGDSAALSETATTNTHILPNDGPTLWSRFVHSDTGKTAAVLVGVVIVALIFRRTSKKRY